MKLINTLLAIFFISLSAPSWSITLDDLVEREGLYYKQFTDVPFTGEVTGEEQGSFKSGKKDGSWLWYWDNGQLRSKVNYKDGKREGASVAYYDNGQLRAKGNFKDGKRDGVGVIYRGNGHLEAKFNYENGKLEVAFVRYWENGQLRAKGNFKNGKKDGVWAIYNEDGTVNKEDTGTYKDGVKISD